MNPKLRRQIELMQEMSGTAEQREAVNSAIAALRAYDALITRSTREPELPDEPQPTRHDSQLPLLSGKQPEPANDNATRGVAPEGLDDP